MSVRLGMTSPVHSGWHRQNDQTTAPRRADRDWPRDALESRMPHNQSAKRPAVNHQTVNGEWPPGFPAGWRHRQQRRISKLF